LHLAPAQSRAVAAVADPRLRPICYDAAMPPTRPRWLLWSALAIFAVCVLYPLSFGPAWWIATRLPNRARREFIWAHGPLLRASWNSSRASAMTQGYAS